MDTFGQHINHKKKPQAIGMIRSKARISVPVFDVHLIAVDFISPAKPIGTQPLQRPYVLYRPAEDDELALRSVLRRQCFLESFPETGSRLQVAPRDSGVVLFPPLFLLVELDHADPVNRERKKGI